MARRTARDEIDNLSDAECRAIVEALAEHVPGTLDSIRRMSRDRGGYHDDSVVGAHHEADTTDRRYGRGAGRDEEYPPPGGAAGGSFPPTPEEYQKDWERRAADKRQREFARAVRDQRIERTQAELERAQEAHDQALGRGRPANGYLAADEAESARAHAQWIDSLTSRVRVPPY